MANRLACTPPMICVVRMTLTWLRRSASTPASGLRNTTGKNSAIDMMPSQAPEWVRVHASQPTETRCSQVPINPIVAVSEGGRDIAEPGREAKTVEGQRKRGPNVAARMPHYAGNRQRELIGADGGRGDPKCRHRCRTCQ